MGYSRFTHRYLTATAEMALATAKQSTHIRIGYL